MVANTVETLTRYADGYDACQRTGKYQGATKTPGNPHKVGTEPFADWFEGFSDALLLQLADIRSGRIVCKPYAQGERT
jgi:hypothetical protein